ncbi:MAG: accessory factor UbiK family protein [Proteobacteria bacterium]|nr:accessory factor UbiK family protein [Pseudomonadota bacterium]
MLKSVVYLVKSGKFMIKAEVVEDLAAKLDQFIPQDIKTMRQDFHKNLKLILTAGLKKADLVTREEFEVQKAVLAKTRAKLEAIEKKLADKSF